jgi:hypothetical protein
MDAHKRISFLESREDMEALLQGDTLWWKYQWISRFRGLWVLTANWGKQGTGIAQLI